MFGSNLKWVEKQSCNFFYLACGEMEFFTKKNLVKNNLLK